MRLTSIDVSSVRNLSAISLHPEPGLNLFYGQNGAGKTSVLEAISLLSSGKSFRAGRIGTIVQEGHDNLTISARLQNEKSLSSHQLGIKLGKDKTVARIDGQSTNRISDLAFTLPCVSISTSNHELVEGGPRERRSFLDWVSFHVDHSYLTASKRYRNALQQRNAALRLKQNDKSLVQTWDSELAMCGEQISISRCAVVESFQTHFKRLTAEFSAVVNPTFSYHRGWAEDLSLKDQLCKNIDYCCRMGVTTAGPHRADMKIRVGKNEARYINSRGQQKLLAILMKLVQVEMYTEFYDHPPILLFDDLPSELDEKSRAFVFRFLQKSGIQVFLTSVEDVSKEIQGVNARFHVKQGKIEKVLY